MRSTGRDGEERAVRHLTRRGWRILHRNWRGGGGELDIVAIRGGVVAFIEVKARAEAAELAEPIRAAQRERLVRAATAYIACHPSVGGAPARFDVIAVAIRAGRPRITHIRDAFQAPATASPPKSRSSVYATDRNERR